MSPWIYVYGYTRDGFQKDELMKLAELFAKARLKDQETRLEGEGGKLGNLRAGNSGIYSESGDMAGSCIRKAHVRALGLELEEKEEHTLLMFDLGFANEEVVAAKLKAALPAGYMILQEEEIPIEWTTSKGVKVTGRPDIVICKIDLPETNDISHLSFEEQLKLVKPTLGLELKSVHSMWTARDVLFGGKPKLSNVIQAAHYMWKVDVPYKLIYTAYSQLGQGVAGTDSWVNKQFPRKGQPGSEYVEYNDKGQIKHIKQFQVIYDMQFSPEGNVQYKLESEDKWADTIVTRGDIERFFEKAAEIGTVESLGPRPAQIDTLGKKANYSDCNYCPMKDACDKYEKKGYSQWIQEVKKLAKVPVK